jgi:hypothetical protein
MLGPEAVLRTPRVYVDALRRITEAEATVFEDYIVASFEKQGLGFADAMEMASGSAPSGSRSRSC